MLNSLLNGCIESRKTEHLTFTLFFQLPDRGTDAEVAFECNSSAVSSARPSKNGSDPAATTTSIKTLSLGPRLSLRSEQGRGSFWGAWRPSSEFTPTLLIIAVNSWTLQTLSDRFASGKGKNAKFS
jgi:hypothetical protein